jgi:hypothetical protein
MIKQILSKIPGGQNVQVFVGTTVLVGLCGVPVFFKNEKRGHDLFSQEKPEAVLDSQEKLLKEFDRKSKLDRKGQDQDKEQSKN